MSDAGGAEGELSAMSGHSDNVAQNLRQWGMRWKNVTRNSARNAQVLEMMHEKFGGSGEEVLGN